DACHALADDIAKEAKVIAKDVSHDAIAAAHQRQAYWAPPAHSDAVSDRHACSATSWRTRRLRKHRRRSRPRRHVATALDRYETDTRRREPVSSYHSTHECRESHRLQRGRDTSLSPRSLPRRRRARSPFR